MTKFLDQDHDLESDPDNFALCKWGISFILISGLSKHINLSVSILNQINTQACIKMKPNSGKIYHVQCHLAIQN